MYSPRILKVDFPKIRIVRCHKLIYFGLELKCPHVFLMNRLMLTNDYESDISMGAEKDNFWDWNVVYNIVEHSYCCVPVERCDTTQEEPREETISNKIKNNEFDIHNI